MTNVALPGSGSRNFRKHTNANPAQRWLLGRFHDRIDALVAELLPNGGSVADIGCGEGFVARFLLDRQPDLEIIGFDRDHGAVRLAGRQAVPARFGQGDVATIPLASDSVDLALCLEVLEHIPDPRTTLRELRRIARKWVIVSTPNQPWFSLANLARLKNLPTLGDDPEHIQWWTGPAFVDLVGGTLLVDQVDYRLPWTIITARADA